MNKLGLQVLDDMPELSLLALRAGQVRISIFGGYEPRSGDADEECGTHLIFRTDNLDQTIKDLGSKGVAFPGDVVEAGGFIGGIATTEMETSSSSQSKCVTR